MGRQETFPFTNVYRTVFLSLPCKPKNEISYDSEESEDDKVVHQGESKIEEGVGRKERYWRIDGLKEGVGGEGGREEARKERVAAASCTKGKAAAAAAAAVGAGGWREGGRGAGGSGSHAMAAAAAAVLVLGPGDSSSRMMTKEMAMAAAASASFGKSATSLAAGGEVDPLPALASYTFRTSML